MAGGEILYDQAFTGQDALSFEISIEPGCLSLELWGQIDGAPHRIALISPVYIEYPTLITAHTGAMGTAANQLDGLEELLDGGSDAVEVDVRRHKGRLCLSHDAPLPGFSCPSLADCLSLLKRRPRIGMNLDLKQPGLTMETLKLAREIGAASRLMYTGNVGPEDLPQILTNEIPLWHNHYILPQKEWLDPLAAIRKRGFDTLNIDREQVMEELLKTGARQLSV